MDLKKIREGFKNTLLIISIIAVLIFSFNVFSEVNRKEQNLMSVTSFFKAEEAEIKSIDSGPNEAELRKISESFDLSQYNRDWNFSLVEEKTTQGIRVKTSESTELLYTLDGSILGSKCTGVPDTFLQELVEVGDAIVWSEFGEDTIICPGEIKLIGTAEEVRNGME